MATVSAAKDQLQNVNHVPGNGMMGKSSAKRGQGMSSYQINKHSIASETLVPAAFPAHQCSESVFHTRINYSLNHLSTLKKVQPLRLSLSLSLSLVPL